MKPVVGIGIGKGSTGRRGGGGFLRHIVARVVEILPPALSSILYWSDDNDGSKPLDKIDPAIVVPGLEVVEVNCLEFTVPGYVALDTTYTAPDPFEWTVAFGLDNYALTGSQVSVTGGDSTKVIGLECAGGVHPYYADDEGANVVWDGTGNTEDLDLTGFTGELVFASDGANVRLWADGVYYGYGNTGSDLALYVTGYGANSTGLGQPFIGKLTHVGLWEGYHIPPTYVIKDALFFHTLEEGAGLAVNDSSDSGNDGTLQATVTHATSDNKVSSHYKDGFYVAVQGTPPFIPALANGLGLAANGQPITNLPSMGGHNGFEGGLKPGIDAVPVAANFMFVDSIIVSGTGISVDCRYYLTGMDADRPLYACQFSAVYFTGTKWLLEGTISDWENLSTSSFPPKTGWTLASGPGGTGLPVIEYDCAVVEDGEYIPLYYDDVAAHLNMTGHMLLQWGKLGAANFCHNKQIVFYRQGTVEDLAFFTQGNRFAGDLDCGTASTPYLLGDGTPYLLDDGSVYLVEA